MKLTLPQQDIYFEQLLYPGQPIYNIGAKIAIEGNIDVTVFENAYNELMEQHDAYRCIFREEEEAIAFFVQDTYPALQYIDFSDQEDPDSAATGYIEEAFKMAFDLLNATPPHRFILIKTSENFCYLFSVYHHIITDGWGTSIMFQRLVQLYNELLQPGQVHSRYDFSYTDFVLDDTSYRSSAEFEKDKEYWKRKFMQLPENLFSKLDPSITSCKSSRKKLLLERKFYNRLTNLSNSLRASSLHIILTALYAYLGRRYGSSDFTIALPVLNRSGARFRKTVGLFMGINPLRLQVDKEVSIEELTIEVKNQLKQDYRHQRFPLGQLVKSLQLFNEKERLFNISVSYEKQDYSTHFHNTKTTVTPLTHESERIALALYVREFDGGDVTIDFDYNLNYFTGESVEVMVAHFKNILEDIVAHPGKKIKELEYLSAGEKYLLTHHFNNTETVYPHSKTVADLFEEQAVISPGSVAVKNEQETFTYLQVKQMSDTIALNLINRYGKNNSPVCVIVKRSPTLVILLLGILKAGKSYIPIDPLLPINRINFIIENSGALVIVTDGENATQGDAGLLNLQELLSTAAHNNEYALVRPAAADTAYIIYTSGSTGNPKGVQIGHYSLTNLLTSIQAQPGIKATDLFYAVTTYSFDISILEFFVPLISGATLFVASQDTLADPGKIIAELSIVRPTVLQATPGFYQMLFNANWKGDKTLKILCGGDILSEALAEKLLHAALEVWNMYGPTETTIWSAIKKIQTAQDASNIGKPINNTSFYIVDKHLQLLPAETAGRIFIGGHGLAKGYYNNTVLTEQKFIGSPFTQNEKIYETGDIGKWNNAGEIEFLGRNDNQVKIRGYRIELGEIETELNEYLEVDNAVVIAKKQQDQEAFLVSFIPVLKAGCTIDNIQQYLAGVLPAYMIPAIFIEVDKFPLTSNQKIDRKALAGFKIDKHLNDHVIPDATTALEIKLVEIWQQVLNLKRVIRIDENFFSLGGHSLVAVKISSLIRKQFSVDLSMKDIFENATIRMLSDCIAIRQHTCSSAPVKVPLGHLFKITPAQFIIWLASQKLPVVYNMFSAFVAEAKPNVDKLEKAILAVIQRHEILRTNFIEKAGILYQKINPAEKIDFAIHLYSAVAGGMTDTIIEDFSNYRFNLESDTLIRVAVVDNGHQQLILFLTHHIILDGLSIEILLKEIRNIYAGTNIPAVNDSQFKDFSHWHNDKIAANEAMNTDFWNRYLKDFEKATLVAPDFITKDFFQEPRGRKMLFEIDPQKLVQIKQVATENNTTVFTLLLAVFNMCLHKISYENDICVGIVLNGRSNEIVEPEVGMFVKTLPVRTIIDPVRSFTDYLLSVETNISWVEKHQDLPQQFDVAKIVDILFVFQNPDFSIYDKINFEEFSLKHMQQTRIIPRNPLTFNFNQGFNKMILETDFDEGVYTEETIVFVSTMFLDLIGQVVLHPALPVEAYNLNTNENKPGGEYITIDFEF